MGNWVRRIGQTVAVVALLVGAAAQAKTTLGSEDIALRVREAPPKELHPPEAENSSRGNWGKAAGLASATLLGVGALGYAWLRYRRAA
jgi:hypothetical protein